MPCQTTDPKIKTMLKRLSTAIFFTAVTLASAQAQTFNKAKMDSVLDVLAANNKIMGTMAISYDGKVVYQKATGFSSMTGSATAASNINTRYRIGSISKMFTGVMIMQLVDEGKLTLETTLDKFYPQVPNASKITIEQLLNHHSGIHNFTDDAAYQSYMTQPQTHEQMAGRIAAYPPDFEPGTNASYSNSGFVLLGYIIEKVTKKTYAEALKQRITDKIGLKQTSYGGPIKAGTNEAFPFHYAGSWQPMPQTDMSIPAGAGAIVSTATDLTQFIEALFNGKLVSAASLEKMKTNKDGYGLAVAKFPFNDKIGYGHNGAIDGFLSNVGYFPTEKMAFAFIKNGGDYNINNVALAAFKVYFGLPYKVPTFSQVPVSNVEQYTGVYASPGLPIKITVTKDGQSLVAQATGQSAFPLDATETPGKFVFESAGIEMLFKPEAGQFTLKQGAGSFVFTKEK